MCNEGNINQTSVDFFLRMFFGFANQLFICMYIMYVCMYID